MFIVYSNFYKHFFLDHVTFSYNRSFSYLGLRKPSSILIPSLTFHVADISRTVHETAQPVFLTKNGYGDMVVLSMEAFENLQFESEVYFKLQEAEREAEMTEQRYSSKDVLKAMKAVIGGE